MTTKMIQVCGYLPTDTIIRGTSSRAPEPARVYLIIPGESLSELAMSDRGRDHSPTGFGWAYAGSGPAALAHSILAALCGDQIADLHYQAFKMSVVARLGVGRFDLKMSDVIEWLRTRGIDIVKMGPADPMKDPPKDPPKSRRQRWSRD